MTWIERADTAGMRRRLRATVGHLPAIVVAFAALVVVLDVSALLVGGAYVRERPLWAAFWAMLGLALLAALVIGRRRWAWWLCLLSSIGYLTSPVWGERLHLVYGVVELAFLALLLTPSMRRHASVSARGLKPIRCVGGRRRQDGCPSA
jgi:hypothetical protein